MQPVNFSCSLDIVKAYEDKGRWYVTGFAATTDFDLQDDIITQQAIRSSARDLAENSTVLLNHDPNNSIGKVEKSEARGERLWLKILISKTVPETWQKIKEGVLNKFSVRGKILEAKKKWIPALQKFARLILKMHLVEVSLVAVPANPKAKAVRWYIEKSLNEFEEAGGELEEIDEDEVMELVSRKGGLEMEKQNGTEEEELIEGSGDPDVENEGGQDDAAKGFPPPERLKKEWNGYVEEKGLAGKDAAEIDTAWIEFCKQQGYPQPYPYPYPKPEPQRGTRMRQIVQLVDKLLKDEKDEEKKKILSQIREIARGASYAYPSPKKEESSGEEGDRTQDEPSGDGQEGEDEAEKAGRKMSSQRLSKLRKLLDELQRIIREVEPVEKDVKPGASNEDGESQIEKKIGILEETVKAVAVTLGLQKEEEGKNEDAPTLAEVVQGLVKRLDAIEGVPADKTSIDGQDDLAEGKKGKGLWKGLV